LTNEGIEKKKRSTYQTLSKQARYRVVEQLRSGRVSPEEEDTVVGSARPPEVRTVDRSGWKVVDAIAESENAMAVDKEELELMQRFGDMLKDYLNGKAAQLMPC
jgi:hypothetical protein